MFKKYLVKVLIVISLSSTFGVIGFQELQAQITGPFSNKWLWVSSLRQYFSSTGIEGEYFRRGRGPYQDTDQDDGLRWPAQYNAQDHNVGKGICIGLTNFKDPSNGVTYQYKVVALGYKNLFVNSAVFPVDFKLIGRSKAPIVTVDNRPASDLDVNDLNTAPVSGTFIGGDEIDPTLPTDRMIYNRMNTPVGITISRKVYASTQQYHDNYYIYEYVFKNTGLIDNTGGTMPPTTLTGVMFDFRYRFADAYDAYVGGWTINTADDYGKNTINDVIGQDPAHTLPPPNDFRAIFEYFGPNQAATSVADDIGGPNFRSGNILCGESFIGEMVLHADKSPQDTTDDPTQPTTTHFISTDGSITTITVGLPFQPSVMTPLYQDMTKGHPSRTHAEQIGKDANGWPTNVADTWVGYGTGTGGYGSQQSFGPYTLAPGDSIRIVLAEGVAAISREKNIEVARNWWTWYSNNKSGGGPFILPDGSTTTDGNIYKNSWVFTGKDSLFQTFRRARASYNSEYKIPQPPPPPDKFTITSGGNKISLAWSKSAETWPNFDGYRLYRADTKTDTTFELILSCNKNNSVNSYDDVSAKRGFNYYYYIQTKDDGLTNDIQPGVPLVSSMFYTLTNTAAYLRRPAENSLSKIRVVPNPYNISARSLQYGSYGTSADRLEFFGLPPLCIIKIYTETGDLIRTINHVNGSGDESWDSKTSSGQIVVSGLYIAYFEVTEDGSGFKKGDNIIRKFIIIR